MERNKEMTPLRWHEKRMATGMSIHSEILLDRIREEKMLVSELMNWAYFNNVGSPATIHKAIQDLIHEEFFEAKTQDDARKKMLSITTKGKRYLEAK